jgi:hypothetical protein
MFATASQIPHPTLSLRRGLLFLLMESIYDEVLKKMEFRESMMKGVCERISNISSNLLPEDSESSFLLMKSFANRF